MKLGLAPVIATLEAPNGETLDIPALFERSFRRDLFLRPSKMSPACESFLAVNKMSALTASAKLMIKLPSLCVKLFVPGSPRYSQPQSAAMPIKACQSISSNFSDCRFMAMLKVATLLSVVTKRQGRRAARAWLVVLFFVWLPLFSLAV